MHALSAASRRSAAVVTDSDPQFPIYVVSKGRWDVRMTARALSDMAVRFNLVVERDEAERYRAATDPRFARVLVLDPAYQRDYDTFDDLGDAKSKGPGPARNFAWDHAIAAGAAWHWVLDDNIWHFYRLHLNAKHVVESGAFFRVMEDFCLRYSNIAMAGPNYEMFIPRRKKWPPFWINTRIYSCNLIRNDAPFRWRGRYNEDTDLSLRMLKASWCTVLFNAFLQDKIGTQRVKGGNTDAFYAAEGTLPKSQMLVRMHPDVARLIWKYNRWHHYVDYRSFTRNRLVRRADAKLSSGVNDYGMRLVPVA